jgi:hypothetical protein
VQRSTAKDRFRRALKRVADWCRQHRHVDLREQQKSLMQKLRGHFEYYGITGNFKAIQRFRYKVIYVWRKWLHRRSQRAHMNWDRMHALLERYSLPQPYIAHPAMRRAANP